METTTETIFLVEHNDGDGTGWWISGQFETEAEARTLYNRQVRACGSSKGWRLAKTTVTKHTEFEVLAPASATLEKNPAL